MLDHILIYLLAVCCLFNLLQQWFSNAIGNYIYISHIYLLYQMNNVYHINEKYITNALCATVSFDVCINITSFLIAMKGILTHKIKFYKYFSMVYCLCIASKVALSYINSYIFMWIMSYRWNVLIFVVMLFTYMYARYMIA
jgi:hypothetical protein